MSDMLDFIPHKALWIYLNTGQFVPKSICNHVLTELYLVKSYQKLVKSYNKLVKLFKEEKTISNKDHESNQ